MIGGNIDVVSTGEIEVGTGGTIIVESGGKVGLESGARLEIEGTSGLQIENGGELVVEAGGRNKQTPGISLTSANSTGTALNPTNHIVFNSTKITSKVFTVSTPRTGEELFVYEAEPTSGANKLSLGIEIGSSEGANANNKFLTGTTGTGGLAHLVARSSALWVAYRLYGITATTD